MIILFCLFYSDGFQICCWQENISSWVGRTSRKASWSSFRFVRIRYSRLQQERKRVPQFPHSPLRLHSHHVTKTTPPLKYRLPGDAFCIRNCFSERYVEGADLFVSGAHAFNHYRDCQDLNYFLSAENINDILCLPTDRVHKPTPILGCQDRVLRVLDVTWSLWRHLTFFKRSEHWMMY